MMGKETGGRVDFCNQGSRWHWAVSRNAGSLVPQVAQCAPQPFNLHFLQQFRKVGWGCKITPVSLLDRLLDFPDLPSLEVNVTRDGLFRQKRFGAVGCKRELVELCLYFFGDT